MTYSQKLQDPRWQKKRLQILERDNWQCQDCNSKEKSLQVHHIVYHKGTEPWGYADYLYQTLCKDCHPIRQEITDRIVSAIRIAIKDVPTKRLLVVAQELCAKAMLEIEVQP